MVGSWRTVNLEEVSLEDGKNVARLVWPWGCADMLFTYVFWPQQVCQTQSTHLFLF